ncbi:phage portal protein [Virgibacillus salexigens]|uniref:Phage portal protein, putative, A118 family n=1 Tax=Virgibacillus massiliensis TaxID=1462526 RepID=A0A024QG47_9BACI|nr:phage portal protein [Virgibacillus massiliensis]CDQ41498.1 phage portal protein, putative, A118 family [Virgibacillus massiliensis]
MFRRLINAVKGGLYRLGIIKGIEKISSHKKISINQELYNNIDIWKALYKGYYSEWHDIEYQTISGKKSRKMDTLMMAKTAAAEMASLVFNEKCAISIGDGKNKTSEFIEEVFKKNKFYKKFQDHLEYDFALGGMVIKPYVKEGKIMLSFVSADCFVPISWHNDTITEGVFVSEYKKDNKKYTHLEWHTWEGNTYYITNELYESNGNELGVKVSLSILFPDLQEIVAINNLKKSLFTYFKPNTANNIDIQSPLGISIYANALDTMKAIDTAFDSFHREFRLGKKRIIVPSNMVKTVIDPQTQEVHRYFDDTDETYEAMKFPDEGEPKDINVELRVDEHISGINALLNLFAMQTGFSAGTFSFDGQSVKTATEVISENSKTFKSKKSHETIIEEGLQELIQSIVDVAKLYGLFKGDKEQEVTVTFDDSIVEDNAAEQTRQIQLVNNKLQSKKRAIMEIHGMTDKEALELINEINEENKTANAEDIDFFGTGGSK